MKHSLLFLPITVIAFSCALLSCEKDDEIIDNGKTEQQDPKEAELQKQLSAQRFYMKKYFEEYYPYYFWYDDMVQTVKNYKYDDYTSIFDYFDATLFREDRWSWMMTASDYLSSEAGEQTGTYGVSFGQPFEYFRDYDLHVRFIYPGSPFEEHGVTRGWTLTHMDSVPVMNYLIAGQYEKALYKKNQLFTFKDLEGNPHTFRSSPLPLLNVRSSLITRIFEPSEYPGLTEPVGYFMYLSYKANFLSDIDSAFAKFHEAGVKKVILDLRYNGGGDSRAENLLVNYLAPASADHQVYKRMIHNNALTYLNRTDTISRQPNSLDVDKLYVITGEGTASASEVTINSLRPLLDVYLVGDTTYGKPNGMYVLLYPGTDEDYARYENDDYSKLKLVYLPIAFFNKNGQGESIPYKGFIPSNYRPDDLYHDFGVEEDNIKACLEHIVNGTFPVLPDKERIQTKGMAPAANVKMLDDLMKSPLYGKTLLPAPKELRK